MRLRLPSKSYVKFCFCQNLSITSLFLKLINEGAHITVSGRLFHIAMALWLNECLQLSRCVLCLKSFLMWRHVCILSFSCRMDRSETVGHIFVATNLINLNHITSPASVYKNLQLEFFQPSRIAFMVIYLFVCSPSSFLMSFLKWGFHTETAYSRFCLTSLLKSLVNVHLSRYQNDLITLMMLFALFTLSSMFTILHQDLFLTLCVT